MHHKSFKKYQNLLHIKLTKSLGLSECKEPILRVPPSTVNKRFMCSGRNLVCISFGVCVPWMNWLPRIRTSSFKRTNSCLCFRKRKTWKWKIVIGNGFLSILKHYIDTFWHFSTNWKPLIQSVLMSKIHSYINQVDSSYKWWCNRIYHHSEGSKHLAWLLNPPCTRHTIERAPVALYLPHRSKSRHLLEL